MLQRHGSSPRGLRFAALAAIGLLLFLATGAFAQTAQLSVSIDGFSAQDWSSAQTIVTVLDGDGRPVSGLTRESFRAQVNGSDASVTSVSRGVDSNVPIAVVLALDVSGAMQGPPLDQAKLALHGFLEGLSPNDTVAVVTFGDSVTVVQPLTQDRTSAGAAIDALVAGGGSALYEGTTKGVLQAAASANTGRRAIVLLSASADGGTAGSRQQSLVAAQGLGVPAYVIGLGSGVDLAYLRELTEAGGGRLMQTATPEGLPQLYQNVGELIRDQYVLTVDASALGLSITDATTLHVSVASGEASGGADRVICPSKVCASFHQLQTGARLQEGQTVVADVVSAETVESVSLLVDGVAVQTANASPYEFAIDAEWFKAGDHTIALSVKTAAGETKLGELTVQYAAASSGGGVSLFAMAAVAFVMVAVLLGLFFVWRGRRGRGREAPEPRPDEPTPEPTVPMPVQISMSKSKKRRAQLDDGAPAPPPVDAEPALGYLHSTSGPLAGQTFAVGAKPVSIGSGHRCQIRLPQEIDGFEVPSEYARFWIRKDQLMVHAIRRLTAMGPAGGEWEILSEHETFSIGPCVFRFDREEHVAPPPAAVPNVLREKPSTAPPGPVSTTPVPGDPIANVPGNLASGPGSLSADPPREQAAS